ncbi:MAG: TetR/AcrR family transcriptional regulator [Saccharospirillaceae bacterium]|nr:TetR/AcrR family transcriptional regulator [Saccharospirillaceae bacterium]MCD8530012.1 TetR/AcrR family transcriptional regulator [Saccharospirillaceae bacterium]
MARTKTFDPAQVLQQTMLLFWREGFRQISMERLVQTLGVNRYSLYQTFGNKQQLFQQALVLYTDSVFNRLLSPLQAQQGKTAILAYFRLLQRQLQNDQASAGCMLLNANLHAAELSEESMNLIKGSLRRQEEALKHALIQANENSEFRRSRDPQMASRFLTSQVHAMVLLRQNAGKKRVHDVLEFMIDELEHW